MRAFLIFLLLIMSSASHAEGGENSDASSKVSTVRSRICSSIYEFRTVEGASFQDNMKRIAAQKLGIDLSTLQGKKQFADFWNANNDQMICKSIAGIYPEEHVFRRAIQMRVDKPILREFFLASPNDFPINVNVVVTLANGEKETVLDFLDRILSSPDVDDMYDKGQLIRLQRILELRSEGKRAHELHPGH